MVLVYVSLVRFMGNLECLYVEDQILWGGNMGLSGAEIHCLHNFQFCIRVYLFADC